MTAEYKRQFARSLAFPESISCDARLIHRQWTEEGGMLGAPGDA